jgi:arylsulfatase A-like enzyme
VKTVFILFDSLNRHALSCFNDQAHPTPSFDKLAARSTLYNNHYVGSLPCMPARRDLLTGRLNFLHRSWGPVEPYDQCFPDTLREAGVYTHLISDHYHYWEEGGCGYHNRYSSAEFVRGQERDLWKAMVCSPEQRFRETYHPMLADVPRRHPNMVNREYIRDETDYPISRCVDLSLEFLQHNHEAPDWLLQVELFDPHEPFTAPARFREQLPTDYKGPVLDWPIYDRLDLTRPEADELRANYQAIVAMCDEHLGRILDCFDALNLWQDTAIVLTTDHGFLLGEHEWWGKNRMPALDSIARIPLIIYHPQANGGDRIERLTQCLDVTATLLDFHNCADQQSTHGNTLLPFSNSTTPTRDYAMYGIFGGALNITDGRYNYFRYPVDTSDDFLHEYTLMPVHPASYFSAAEFDNATLTREFEFTRGYPVLKLPATPEARRPPMQGGALDDAQTVLYDLETDPQQLQPIDDAVTEQRMIAALQALMRKNEAPEELYRRFGLDS